MMWGSARSDWPRCGSRSGAPASRKTSSSTARPRPTKWAETAIVCSFVTPRRLSPDEERRNLVGIDPVIAPLIALAGDLAVPDGQKDVGAADAGLASRFRDLHAVGHEAIVPRRPGVDDRIDHAPF